MGLLSSIFGGGSSSKERAQASEAEKELVKVTYARNKFHKEFYFPVENALLKRIEAMRWANPGARERALSGTNVDSMLQAADAPVLSQQARGLFAHELDAAGSLGSAMGQQVAGVTERGSAGAVEGIALGRDIEHGAAAALSRRAGSEALGERASATASAARRRAAREAAAEVVGFGAGLLKK